MAFAVNWGDVLKTAGPAIGAIAAAKTQNRGVENTTAVTQAKDAEQAAVNRAQAEIQARLATETEARGVREAEAQAFKNARTAALMKNMQDVKFADVSGFRSRVPELHFQGGSRPSAMGAEGKALADIMQNRSLQTLMAPQGGGGGGGGGGGQAVPRGGSAAMPAYQPAEQKGAGFWENALGIAGLGATVGGALMGGGKEAAGQAPSYAAQVARNPQASFGGGSFAPAAAGIAGGAGTAAQAAARARLAAQLFPSSAVAPALTSSLPGVSFMGGAPTSTALKGVSFMPGASGAGAATSAAAGAGKGAKVLRMFGGTGTGGATGALGAMNAIAGPAGMAAGIIAPYLPAGQPREMADWASKGAMVGSFFPGFGTAIGAGIGAGIGAVKGHQNQTVGQRKDLAKSLGYGTLDNLYKALEGMGPEGAKLRHQGLNVIGKHDTKGNALWQQQVAALLGRR